jgi:hypothetical protein
MQGRVLRISLPTLGSSAASHMSPRVTVIEPAAAGFTIPGPHRQRCRTRATLRHRRKRLQCVSPRRPAGARMPSSRRQHDSIVIKRQVEGVSRLNTDLGKDRLGDDDSGGIANLSNHRLHYQSLALCNNNIITSGHEISVRWDPETAANLLQHHHAKCLAQTRIPQRVQTVTGRRKRHGQL